MTKEIIDCIYNNKNKISDAEAEFFFKNYYQDRGMRKWQGFFLSDHKKGLKGVEKEKKSKPVIKEQQSLELITQKLKMSYEHKKIVVIQLVHITSDNEVTELSGIIRGFNENKIYFTDEEEVLHVIELEKIKNCYLPE